MNCLLVMKIKRSLDINTGAVERSEAARARRLDGATVVEDDVIASTGYMKKQPTKCQRRRREMERYKIEGSGRNSTDLPIRKCPGLIASIPSSSHSEGT